MLTKSLTWKICSILVAATLFLGWLVPTRTYAEATQNGTWHVRGDGLPNDLHFNKSLQKQNLLVTVCKTAGSTSFFITVTTANSSGEPVNLLATVQLGACSTVYHELAANHALIVLESPIDTAAAGTYQISVTVP